MGTASDARQVPLRRFRTLLLALLLAGGPGALAAQEAAPPAAPPASARDARGLASSLRELRREGRAAEALSMFEAAPKETRVDPRVLGERLQAFLDLRQVGEVRRIVARLQLPDVDPSSLPLPLAVALVRLAWQRGEVAEARRLSGSLLAQRPDNVDLRLLEARLLAEEERFAEASAALAAQREAVSARLLADAEADVARIRAALLLLDDGNLERVVGLLADAREAAPWRGDLAALGAQALGRLRRFAEAEALLDAASAVSAEVDLPELEQARGVLHLDLAQPAEARACFERVLAALPHHPGAEVGLACCLVLEDRRREAVVRLEEAVASQRDPIDALLALADLRESDDDLAGATEALRAVLERQPDHLGALGRLARVAARQGNSQQAEALAARYAARREQIAGR